MSEAPPRPTSALCTHAVIAQAPLRSASARFAQFAVTRCGIVARQCVRRTRCRVAKPPDQSASGKPGASSRDVEPVHRVRCDLLTASQYGTRPATIVAPAIPRSPPSSNDHVSTMRTLSHSGSTPAAATCASPSFRLRMAECVRGDFASNRQRSVRAPRMRQTVERESRSRAYSRVDCREAIAIVGAVRFHQHERLIDQLRDVIVDRIAADRSSLLAHTAVAPSSVHVPAKTESRANSSSRSAGPSSW